MFSALSENQGGLKDKIDIFVACAPVITMNNSPNTMFDTLANVWKPLENAISWFGFEAVGTNPNGEAGLGMLCSLFAAVCDSIHS